MNHVVKTGRDKSQRNYKFFTRSLRGPQSCSLKSRPVNQNCQKHSDHLTGRPQKLLKTVTYSLYDRRGAVRIETTFLGTVLLLTGQNVPIRRGSHIPSNDDSLQRIAIQIYSCSRSGPCRLSRPPLLGKKTLDERYDFLNWDTYLLTATSASQTYTVQEEWSH